MKAEPPTLPRRDDVLVDKGAAVPKPCLSPVEMRTLTAAGNLLPAGIASTVTRIVYYQLAASLVLADRGGKFSDFKSICHGLKQFLEVEGLKNKIKANSGI